VVSHKEAQLFYEHVAPRSGMSAVDLVCGNGQWTRQLAAWRLNATQALARIRQIAGQRPVPQGEPGAGLYRREQGSAADVDTDLDRSASGGGRGSESDHRG
jgi:hypothetical protein